MGPLDRDRLLEGAVAARFLSAILAQPRVKRLLSSDHFTVDGTLVEAWLDPHWQSHIFVHSKPELRFNGRTVDD